jgi:hypothetical protein
MNYGPTRRTALLALAAALIGLLGANFSPSADAAASAHAENVYGKYVSFQNGVLSLSDVTGGLVKGGSRDLNIPNNIPVIVFIDANHIKTGHSPDAFANATAGQNVEVTVDTNGHVVNVQVGVKAHKGKKSKS